MPGALLGATCCGRCGHAQRTGTTCVSCSADWTPAVQARVTTFDSAPLLGVVRTTPHRRHLAQLIDLVPPLGLVALGWAAALRPVRSPLLSWGPVAAAGLVTVVLVGILVLRGRSLGRVLLRQRTVDDLTGTPAGTGRLLRQGGPFRGQRFITADLRRGRDPLRVRLTPIPVPTSSAPPISPTPQPSVAIRVNSGETHQIHRSLLIGRHPRNRSAGDPRSSEQPALLTWPDRSRRLARTHVLLEWSGTVLWVTDLGSATGTAILSPGGDRLPLAIRVRAAAAVGSRIDCGGHGFEVVSGG